MSQKNTRSQNSRKPRNELTHRNKLGYIDPTIAGIDIGANLIHVAIPNLEGGTDVYEFATTTPELHRIAKDLKKSGVITAVMEATGVYWIPLYELMRNPSKMFLGVNQIFMTLNGFKHFIQMVF